MTSTASLKELSKAIAAFIPRPAVPLPDDLIEVIAAYLRKHQKYDDATADRLQEELLSIFHKHVKGNGQATVAWWSIVRRLLPVLQTPERILQWFDASEGAIESVAQDKGFATESVAGMMDLVTVADQYHDSSAADDSSNPIIGRLLSIWMNRFYPASLQGSVAMLHNEKMIREPLVEFGKKRPKAFFASLDSYLVQKEYRKAALRFFCDYLQSRPSHLFEIEKSSLFTNLLACLQRDKSTAVVSAALTALIMLLPNMPGSLVPYLPVLFNIYARVLFWERDRSGAVGPPPQVGDQTRRWDACDYGPDTEIACVAHIGNYYTILYGLYPINFMDYIRKPQRYLRHANVPNADDIEVQPTEIRQQSERFRRCHLLHPNFYTLTIDSEKTDFGRWAKSEASDVVAECIELCLEPEQNQLLDYSMQPVATALNHLPQEAADKSGPDAALLSTSITLESRTESWRNATSISADSLSTSRSRSTMMRQSSPSSQPSNRDSGEARARDVGGDSPTLPPNLSTSESHTQLQDMIQSNKAIKSGLHQSLTNDSVPSLSLSQHESVTDKPGALPAPPTQQITAPMSLTDAGSQVPLLQRQILLLQNDLSFERYMKQQHISHIGDLRKRQMAEAVTEAETQNLLLMNRNLKSRYEEAKKAEMQVRKESERSRTLAKKWEADLANKLKNLRDESKKTNADFDAVRRELDNSKEEADKLRKMVCDAEVKDLTLKQNMQSIDIHADEVERLHKEVDRLKVSERDYQAREQERMIAIRSAAEAESQAETMGLRLAALESELQRTKKLCQSQVAALQAKVTDASDNAPRITAARIEMEDALAASRAKQAEMQKQYGLLMRKYTALHSSLLDVQSGASALRTESSSVAEGDGTFSSMSSSPINVRMRTQRILSNPDTPDITFHNTTWPLDTKVGSGHAGESLVASPTDVGLGIDTAGSASGSGVLSASPEQRYFGRGGVQNKIRREGKDKHKEEPGASGGTTAAQPGKKEKKSSGLRGIRGLV